MKIRPTLTILSILSLISCQGIIDNLREEEANENYVSPFKGVYKGNYSGDEVGSLTIEVAQNGYISVTKVSQFSTEKSFDWGFQIGFNLDPTSGNINPDTSGSALKKPQNFRVTMYGIAKRNGQWHGSKINTAN